MKDRKKPEQFWLPHGMPSDERECAFSSRVFPKASQIQALYKLETIASLPGFGMALEGHLSYSFGPNIPLGRIKPCSVRVRIDPILPKELLRLPTCHRQRSSLTVAPTSGKPVRVARTRLTEINSSSGGCTTSGISTCGVRVIWWSPIRSITVRSVASTFTRTSPIWHPPEVSTPTA